jgi:hypothetical protein
MNAHQKNGPGHLSFIASRASRCAHRVGVTAAGEDATVRIHHHLARWIDHGQQNDFPDDFSLIVLTAAEQHIQSSSSVRGESRGVVACGSPHPTSHELRWFPAPQPIVLMSAIRSGSSKPVSVSSEPHQPPSTEPTITKYRWLEASSNGRSPTQSRLPVDAAAHQRW